MKFQSLSTFVAFCALNLAGSIQGASASVIANSVIDWSSFNVQLIDSSNGANAPEFRWSTQNATVESWAFVWSNPPSNDYPRLTYFADDYTSELTTHTATTLSQSHTIRNTSSLESYSQSAADNLTNGYAHAGNYGNFELSGNGLAVMTVDWHQSVSGGAEGDIYNWANATTNIYANYSDTDGATSRTDLTVATNTYDAVPQSRQGTFVFVISGDGEHTVYGMFGASASARTMISRAEVSVQAQVSAVPVPAAVWLFASAILGFLGFTRRSNGVL